MNAMMDKQQETTMSQGPIHSLIHNTSGAIA
jgi:hypothetical protein